VLDTVVEALAQLEGPQAEPTIPAAGSSLDFLQAVYRDPCQPISRRMRAAVAALPFEHPKLAVTATLGPNSGFAARLETAIKRSRGDLVVIDATPAARD
jgi:hypothetical protein